MSRIILVSLLFGSLLITAPAMADENDSLASTQTKNDQTFAALQEENTQLTSKIADLESVPSINADALVLKNLQHLKEIAADVRTQRTILADSETYVKWMATNLSGYSKYIQAGSFAAGFAKVLPIPYAGQASLLTKFISQGVLSLNAASVSLSRYLTTSRDFIARVEALDQATPLIKGSEVAKIARFADDQLRRDMNDAKVKLTTTSEISSSTLSFLESLNHYVGCTDEYWSKTKSFITRADTSKKEQGYLSQSIQKLREKAVSFNKRLTTFQMLTKKDETLITSLRVYDDLIREMSETIKPSVARKP
ncbi:MAG: hypothetical protein AB9919_08040 [Geobacteraceae bacterium]